MPLNENEERILHEIERRFYQHDPGSARRIDATTLSAYLARNCRWAALGFVAGLVVLLASFASSWILGVFGFVVMLGCGVAFTQSFRRMGRHRMEQLAASMRGRDLGEVLEETRRRLRRRLGGGQA